MVDWPHVAQVRFCRSKKASFGKKTCRLAIPLITGQKVADLSKVSIFYFLPLMGQKGVFWVKKRCFWVLRTECEGADLQQRQGTTTVDHRNKIQSLILPTDDPGDAPDCSTEYGLLRVNMAIHAVNQPFLQNKGFSCSPSWI